MARPLTRRALLFTGPRRVDIVDEPVASLLPGQVLARTLVSALSAGTELLAFRGELPADAPLDETLGALDGQTCAYPFRYGYAAVAEVVAAAEDVDPTWIGRRAFAFQPHATLFVARAADLQAVPEGMDLDRAALLAHMETAVNLVLDGAPRLGERVLVIGQGAVGLLVTALLARFPLAALHVREPVAQRAQAARALGASGEAIAPGTADLVFELSGDPAALDQAIAAAGHEARIVVGSWYGQKRAPIDLGGRFHRRRLRLVSSQVSHIGAELSARWDRPRRFDVAWQALRALDPRPLISHRVPFAEAQGAYELIDRHPAGVLQVLLTYPET